MKGKDRGNSGALNQPGLNDGKSVLTHWYFASSLVYRVQDGLMYHFIQNLNNEIHLPLQQ